MYLCHNAEMGADLFEATILKMADKHDPKININVVKLRGKACNQTNICKILQDASYLNVDKIIIYYSGHGDHCNGKEFWQTSSGNVDQIRIAELINHMKPPVIIFSDSCSSEHLVNQNVINHPYISFGATLDQEDAMMQYGGGLFTTELVDCLEKADLNITPFELFNILIDRNVEVQHFSLKYSDDELLNSAFL